MSNKITTISIILLGIEIAVSILGYYRFRHGKPDRKFKYGTKVYKMIQEIAVFMQWIGGLIIFIMIMAKIGGNFEPITYSILLLSINIGMGLIAISMIMICFIPWSKKEWQEVKDYQDSTFQKKKKKYISHILFNKNQRKMIEIFHSFMTNYKYYENLGIGKNCYELVFDEFIDELKKNREDIKNWQYNEEEFESYVISTISSICYISLISGKYHIAKGYINPCSYGNSLRTCYKNTMQWALEHGKITVREQEEEEIELNRRIREIG